MKNRDLSNEPVIKRFLLLLEPIRKEIKSVYLFGSRSRDDWRPDSDYDILIVVEKKERALIDKLYDIVMDILLETGRLVSLKIFTEEEFNRLRSIPTLFMEKVLKEGIKLGTCD